ncbi:MAG: hypothetical protein IJE78_04160, partial [Bacteroidaceae bacterium]|nr:hypothetical protein [Bacteroidaceae bacterium]
ISAAKAEAGKENTIMRHSNNATVFFIVHPPFIIVSTNIPSCWKRVNPHYTARLTRFYVQF